MMRGLSCSKNPPGSSANCTSMSTAWTNWNAWIFLGLLKRWITWGAVWHSCEKKSSPRSSAVFASLEDSQLSRRICESGAPSQEKSCM